MKILVISDSHRNINNVVKILEYIKSLGVVAILHCGDHAEDSVRLKNLYPDLQVEAVHGNCDGMASLAECSKVVHIGGVPIFMTHGHRHGVKYGEYEELYIDAVAHEARVALCGHSHAAYIEKKQGIILLNPGSISLPRDSRYPSYGILDIESGFVREAAIMQIADNNVICMHPVSCSYRNK